MALFTLPPEAKFASVESVQRYVDDVLARVGAAPVTVRARRGTTAAQAAKGGMAAQVFPSGQMRRDAVDFRQVAQLLSRCGAAGRQPIDGDGSGRAPRKAGQDPDEKSAA